MDQAREALIVRELDGAILSWNRGAEALYGWPAADALGQRGGCLAAKGKCGAGAKGHTTRADRSLGG